MGEQAPSLREVQERFYALVTAPAGVARALDDEGRAPASLARWFRSRAPLDALARLDVYANMYFYRIRDVLAADFPKVATAVGADAFHDLVTDYLLARPPRSPSLRDVGKALPELLRAHRLSLARPWLADLALLEWSRLDVFDAVDARVLTVSALQQIAPEQLAELPIRFVPAHALVESEWAIDAAWRAPDAELPALEVPKAETRLLVWRQELDVYHRRLEGMEPELALLGATGAPFGILCDRITEWIPLLEAPRVAFTLLARWIGDGLICA